MVIVTCSYIVMALSLPQPPAKTAPLGGSASVIDERIGQRQVELDDRLQSLERSCRDIHKVSKQRIDKLLQIIALVGPDCDELIESL